MTTHSQMANARARLQTWRSSKWKLERLLGVGGTASVYAARHRNGARAAIKVLHRELAEDAHLRRRLMREALIANRIEHPAVVRVLDDEEDAIEPFLVMELVEGTTLLDACEEGPLDAPELLDVAEQLLDALVVAHAEGIIHRDLKPQNLMVDRRGRLRIFDFGIARVLDDDAARTLFTNMGAIWGTLEFMAPEQLVGSSPAGPRADVYAVGATLFSLASNQFVHDEPDTRKRVLRTATTPARSLESATGRFQPSLVALVDRATRHAPEHRWPSADDMLREVRRLRRSERAPDWSARIGNVFDVPSKSGGTRAFEPLPTTGTRPYLADAPVSSTPSARARYVTTQRFQPVIEPPEATESDEPIITVEESLDEELSTPPTIAPAIVAPRRPQSWSRRMLAPLAIVAVCSMGARSLGHSTPAAAAKRVEAAAPPTLAPAPAPVVVAASASTVPVVVAPSAPPPASAARPIVGHKPATAHESTPPPAGYKGWISDPY